MSPNAARWFAIGTGLLALVAVCVAALMGLRLHKTRTALLQAKQDGCPPAVTTRTQ